MIPDSMSPEVPPPDAGNAGDALPPLVGLRNISPLRMAKIHPPEEYVDRARYEIATVLQYWGYRPELWNIIGFTAAATDRLSAAAPVAHPIVEVVMQSPVMMQSPMVVRCQPMSLSERDIVARHALMRHFTARGLPVPALLSRPEGSAYAVVPVVPLTDPQQADGFSYVLENAIYDVQAYVPGRRFVTDGPSEDSYLEAAAQTLAALHTASLDFPGPAHRWPEERSALALARLYVSRIAAASHGVEVSRALATGLRRLARAGELWVTAAAERIERQSDLPRLHIHGDYQPHNLAFEADSVCAIYDFDAMHWDWRILELAYALLAFTGLRWEDETAASVAGATPPLVARGLDLERARAFLTAYGEIATPRPGEADLLGDALLLVLPVIFVNGVVDDLFSAEQSGRSIYSQRECRAHLEWAETFPAWVEAHRKELRDAWQR
jgi:homoserine kinase type II